MAAAVRSTLQAYYSLTKPGIIYGNGISAAAGFLFASGRQVDWLLLAATLAGTSLVIAAACVLNNYLDRDIDSKMARTKRRALVSGQISGQHALIYAAILSLIGFASLAFFTNILTVYIGLTGLYFYVIAYGIWKRRSPIGTLVGSVAGAMPILAGYTAASGRLDMAAAILFLAMAWWQMPHFYAIALYRLGDYRAAGLPVLPAVKGAYNTKVQILGYIVAFALTTSLLTLYGYASYTFMVAMVTICAVWFWKGQVGFNANEDATWARRMFRFSLIVMLVFSALLALDAFLP